MTPEQADKLLTVLYAGFPFADNGLKPEQSKARRLLYRGMVQRWAFETAMLAAEQVMRRSEFFPTLAVLEAAYHENNRPHPERIALPAGGGGVASVDEQKAAFAEALRLIAQNEGLRK